MAKDRRDKTGNDRVDLSKRVASSQNGRTAGQPSRPTPRKKKKSATGNKILIGLLVVLIIAIVYLLVTIGVKLYDTFFAGDTTEGETIATEEYDTTPQNYQGKVGYYLLGLMGDEPTDSLEMLTLMCYDKEKNTVNFLEFPVDTYLGESDNWDVRRIGNVWGNPKGLPWCDVCRRQVEEDEIVGGKHETNACGAEVTEKAGSPYRDLIKVFNEQYSMPIDEYFIMPQQALVDLIDGVGGVDVSLSRYMMLNDIEYAPGVQTLDGIAALQYIVEREEGVSGDLTRIINCRQVYAALLQRILALDSEEMFNTDPYAAEEGVVGEVMRGSNPIRTDATQKEMTEILMSLKNVSPSAVTMYRLPGEVASLSGSRYYSVHKAELLKLLRQSFDPYGEEIYGKSIQSSELNITEIANDETGDTKKQLMKDVVEKQEGFVIKTTDPTTTDAE